MALNELLSRLTELFTGENDRQPAPILNITNDAPLRHYQPRVLLIDFNPILNDNTGVRLREYMGWNDPEALCAGYIADIAECSGGRVNYKIVDRRRVDEFPIKEDGFCYTPRTYLSVMNRKAEGHKPDWLDYGQVIKDHNIIGRVMMDEIDEVWMFGFPYAGFYESRMIGEDAFWCNSPGFDDPMMCGGVPKFVMMGFSYERGVGEMLENFGHRTESVMTKVYQNWHGSANLYQRFIRHDKTHPRRAEVGWMHYAPNSDIDYDWGNGRVVMSACDDWLNFPYLTGEQKPVNCGQWGHGDIREHHKWWFHRLPKAAGSVDGIRCDWWSYVMEMDA
jgi:hypothetical protein